MTLITAYNLQLFKIVILLKMVAINGHIIRTIGITLIAISNENGLEYS